MIDESAIVWMGVVVLVVATGCVGTEPSERSEFEVKAAADQEALEWDEDAQLVTVIGGEGELEGLVRDGSLAWLPPYVDGVEGRIGDGRSPQWAFEYRVGDQGLGVLVSSDGAVLNSTEVPIREKPPLGDVAVDPAQAIETARQRHSAWGEDVDVNAAVYALFATEDEGRDVWALGVLGEHERRSIVTVDASTGAYLGPPEEGQDPITRPGHHAGFASSEVRRSANTFEGTVDVLDPRDTFAVPIQSDGHGWLGVDLSASKPATATVNATLALAGNPLLTLEIGPQDPHAYDAWPRPQEGTYNLTIELREGLEQDYTIHWCATGNDEGDDPNPACSEGADGPRRYRPP